MIEEAPQSEQDRARPTFLMWHIQELIEARDDML